MPRLEIDSDKYLREGIDLVPRLEIDSDKYLREGIDSLMIWRKLVLSAVRAKTMSKWSKLLKWGKPSRNIKH